MYDRAVENGYARDVSVFILAGGKSTRMGTDKAFVEYEGSTLLARALDLARSVASGRMDRGKQRKVCGVCSGGGRCIP